MKKALAILATVATVGATMMSGPAEARGRGFGPGLAFGLAAGAITAGAVAGFRSLRTLWAGLWLLRGTCYGAGPYAYYGGPYYVRHRHWRHYW